MRVLRYNFESQQAPESVDEYPDGSVSTKVKEAEEGLGISKDQIRSIDVVEVSRSYSEKECPTLDDVTSMKYMKRVVASLLRQMNVQVNFLMPSSAVIIIAYVYIYDRMVVCTKVMLEFVSGTRFRASRSNHD